MTSKRVKSVCPYCGVGCGIVMEVADNRVIKVSGDKSHPTNFGRLCTKGNTCAQAIAVPGRLEHAYVRSERMRDPVRIDIDAAIKETATRLRAIIDNHGPDAVAFYVSGQMSLEAQYLVNKLSKGFVRTNNIESNSRLCMASAGNGYKLSLGADAPPGSYQDFDKADVFFVIGANMADCHPILFLRMMDRVKAGAKLIVVDPRRNTTADKAHLFMQIRPGTDLALLNGLLHLLVKNGHTDADFIARFTEGWDAMPAFLEDYTPENVAAITGISESDIRQAAEWIGSAPNWMSCWTMGLNQSTHGTWNTNAICNLHLATGAICRPGSGPLSLTGQPNAMGGREMGYMGPGLPGQRSVQVQQDRDFVEDLWRIPRGALRSDVGGGTIDMFERIRDGAIKACWIICTNPVATIPNRDNVIASLKAAELVITQDAFLDTETNRFADILLPGALWAEAEGVMVNSERNMTLMAQAVPPPGEALPDWQIIARIACEMGYADAFSYASVAEVFEEITRACNPDTGYDIRGASHARLRATPLQWPCADIDGDDRNPVRYLNDGVNQTLRTGTDGERPRIAFPTGNGRAMFFARPHMSPAEMPDDEFPLVLNTGRLQHQWHTLTKTGRIATLNKLNPGPFIEIHPHDATSLGIRDKDRVEVRSRRGRAVLPAVVTRRVLPGNCFAPFHWNDVFGEDLAINAVTSDAVDPVSLQPEFKFCAVRLARVASRSGNVLASDLLASDGDLVAVETVACDAKELDMNQIDALAQLLGLNAAPAIALAPQEQLYLQGYVMGLRSDASRRAGGVPVLPPSAPVAVDTRVMLDGVLAGLFARSWVPESAAADAASAQSINPPITILWASQTGNVEGFAARCAQRLKAAGQTVQLHSMDTFRAVDLATTQRLLILTSTFGDGDAPDNGTEFWNALQAEPAPQLGNTQFSVLAFGDSNYDQFCGFGKKLDARLEALGATRLHARSDCDSEFETTATAWLDAVVTALTPGTAVPTQQQSQQLVALAGDIDEEEPAARAPATPAFSKQKPLLSRLLTNRLLNAEGSEKETRQFAFDLASSGFPNDGALSYEAGDALGVWPVNCPEVVDDMIAALKLSPTAIVEIPNRGAMELRTALSKHLEIVRITADILQFISAHSGSEKLAALLKDENKVARQQWLWGRQLIDVLHEFPITVDAGTWIAQLKPLQPRLYSIASSPLLHPSQVHVTVSTVRYGIPGSKSGGKKRGGVCSTFLADRAVNAEIPLFVQKATHFRPPRDATIPMIMVGPGTGIAPFRAFLQQREATGATGKNWLFFGEQRAASDFYYRDEIERMQKQGTLHRLDTAFSRDQSEKIYVQQRMIEQGAELWRWLQQGAYFYVCGDATRMAKDVDAALRQVVRQHGGMSAELAGEYVARMSADKRYVRDVY